MRTYAGCAAWLLVILGAGACEEESTGPERPLFEEPRGDIELLADSATVVAGEATAIEVLLSDWNYPVAEADATVGSLLADEVTIQTDSLRNVSGSQTRRRIWVEAALAAPLDTATIVVRVRSFGDGPDTRLAVDSLFLRVLAPSPGSP